MMDRDQEIEMVRDCQNGDRQAFAKLVKELQKPVYNAAYRMLGNADEAADVAQTTFLKVFENIDRYDPKFRLFSWTYRIAVNTAIDELKKRRRSVPLEQTPDSAAERPAEAVDRARLSDEVQATLMELTDDQRAVIVLRYFSDCSYDDIGRILEIPGKTVKSRLYSARQQMRNKLEAHGVFSS